MDRLLTTGLQAGTDILPIVSVILFFQIGILRRLPAQLGRILLGSLYALLGLILFRMGLEDTLLPLGSSMAADLAQHGEQTAAAKNWYQFYWLILFAGLIGLAATLIEPTLIAIANRVQDLTGGELRALDLRLVVACGVALGLALGTARIVAGVPIMLFAVPMVLITTALALKAPRGIAALALDTGPMATSVVTVPLIAAFGSSVARTIPGRDPVLDGFGLIFFALLTPVMSMLIFSMIRQRITQTRTQEEN